MRVELPKGETVAPEGRKDNEKLSDSLGKTSQQHEKQT